MQHDYANEWFWSANAGMEIDHLRLSMANMGQVNQPIIPPSPNGSFTNGVVTDLSICVGMRDVNLNSERRDYDFQHKINHWYNNLDVMKELRKPHMWNHAYAKYFCNSESLSDYVQPVPAIQQPAMAALGMHSDNDYHHPMYNYMLPDYQSAVSQPPPPPPLTPSALQYNAHHLLPFMVSDMKAHPTAMAVSPPPCLAQAPEPSMLTVNSQSASFDGWGSVAIPSMLSMSSAHSASTSTMPACLTSTLLTTESAATCNGETLHRNTLPLAPPPPPASAILSKSTIKNVLQRYCIRNGHVAAPKKKWIINYMMSKYLIFIPYFLICSDQK